MTDADLEAAGENALAEAVRLWQCDVYDPMRSDVSPQAMRSRGVIENILRVSGWTWEIPYGGDGQVEWCGLFVAACWYAAGIQPKWLATYFASTYRLDLWARYQPFSVAHPNPKPEDGPRRLLAVLDPGSTHVPFTPRAGDILMIGDGSPEMGDHICLVESYDDATGMFKTYEGNGVGLGPDGKRRQGIVRGMRHLGGGGYCARRLIRPAPGDLLPPIPALQ